MRARLVKGRRIRERFESFELLAEPSHEQSPDRDAVSREESARICVAIDALPGRWRTVSRLRWILDRSVAEIAPEIAASRGVGVWQVRKLLEQSREMIRSELDGVPARRVWPSRYREKT